VTIYQNEKAVKPDW